MTGGENEAVRIHGTLVEVNGLGVLLLGTSGIGKSECAIALVKYGHRLVADDVVLVEPAECGLVGTAPELVRHYVELRGIGIVHVPSVYGEESVTESAPIDLVVQFEVWRTEDVERVGLADRVHSIAGVDVPCVHLPVTPGRNLATLVEVAARKRALERSGRRSAAELDERVTAMLRSQRT